MGMRKDSLQRGQEEACELIILRQVCMFSRETKKLLRVCFYTLCYQPADYNFCRVMKSLILSNLCIGEDWN